MDFTKERKYYVEQLIFFLGAEMAPHILEFWFWMLVHRSDRMLGS